MRSGAAAAAAAAAAVRRVARVYPSSSAAVVTLNVTGHYGSVAHSQLPIGSRHLQIKGKGSPYSIPSVGFRS